MKFIYYNIPTYTFFENRKKVYTSIYLPPVYISDAQASTPKWLKRSVSVEFISMHLPLVRQQCVLVHE